MDKNKKTKAGGKKDAAKHDDEAAAASGEVIFNKTGNDDMMNLNFVGEEEQFGEKEREPNIIHLHYQQRTTRKCITIIQGLTEDLDEKKILRAFKKMFHCNGTTVEDEEKGKIIQLQGDFRKAVAQFFVEEGIAAKDEIKIHGI